MKKHARLVVDGIVQQYEPQVGQPKSLGLYVTSTGKPIAQPDGPLYGRKVRVTAETIDDDPVPPPTFAEKMEALQKNVGGSLHLVAYNGELRIDKFCGTSLTGDVFSTVIAAAANLDEIESWIDSQLAPPKPADSTSKDRERLERIKGRREFGVVTAQDDNWLIETLDRLLADKS